MCKCNGLLLKLFQILISRSERCDDLCTVEFYALKFVSVLEAVSGSAVNAPSIYIYHDM